jgi:hypothetical protein
MSAFDMHFQTLNAGYETDYLSEDFYNQYLKLCILDIGQQEISGWYWGNNR